MRSRRSLHLLSSCAVGAGACLLLSALAPIARAGFPGSGTIAEFFRTDFQHVCSNDASTVCALDTASGTYPATECPAATPAATCVPDFVEGAEIRALLTVVADDRSASDDLVEDVDLLVLTEFDVGSEHVVLANVLPAGSEIGEWFGLQEEDDVFSFNFDGGRYLEDLFVAGDGLEQLRDSLEEIGRTRLGVPATGVRAVLVSGAIADASTAPGPKAPTVDASGAGDPLASVARYRVTVRFVRLRTP